MRNRPKNINLEQLQAILLAGRFQGVQVLTYTGLGSTIQTDVCTWDAGMLGAEERGLLGPDSGVPVTAYHWFQYLSDFEAHSDIVIKARWKWSDRVLSWILNADVWSSTSGHRGSL